MTTTQPPASPAPSSPAAARRELSARLLVAGYALGVPGTVAAPWIMRRRNVPAFLGLLTGSALITAGWGLQFPHGRARVAFPVNALGFAGFLAWWRKAGQR